MPTTPRRTQLERRTATRTALLDATVECLVERGYAGTTLAEILARTGMARGTLMHHFPTKSELLVAATRHASERRMQRLRHEAQLLPDSDDRIAALVDLAWRDLSSPTFFAALELWVAARTDAELRAALIPAERDLFTAFSATMAAVAGPLADDPRAATLVEFTIDVLTGLTMTTLLTSDLGGRELLLRRWKRALGVLFGRLAADDLVERRR